ncbi:hypothetical protein [Leekyejoonella antrihumi]|uniref:Uncharacterized protein n=1 Tax=Leekyejoonella antrihumi TaxID=1660198 RepID=A0A563E880_9MICO|nr:hypothetical protein [Leekyejoonella antrihumi]TWP38519.1 hypothetical protein FGL98_01610 [Leekyejoonella antrihumi]
MAQRKRRPPRRNATRTQVPRPQPAHAELNQTFDDAAASVIGEIARARHPFGAEAALCGAFYASEAAAPQDADDDERLAALTTMLTELVTYAERLADDRGLAFLRAASILGPDATRDVARSRAQALASKGVPDRPWAEHIGRPSLLRAWHYGDDFGEQESIGLTFSYRGRDHTMLVLIDHLLGGGVKDCWVSEGRKATKLHDDTARTIATKPATFFRDVDAPGAASVLETALTSRACPIQPDQVEDVAQNLYLLRSRTENLGRLQAAGR